MQGESASKGRVHSAMSNAVEKSTRNCKTSPGLTVRMTGDMTGGVGSTADEVGAETRWQWIEDSAGGEEVEINTDFDFNRLGLEG